jgi:hypothetical protein
VSFSTSPFSLSASEFDHGLVLMTCWLCLLSSLSTAQNQRDSTLRSLVVL